MVTITTTYLGELRCRATHEPSGSELLTDAPRDNCGKGEAFSPTDLVATALATCMLTTMGIAARALGVAMEGATAQAVKEMVVQPTRRIGSLTVEVNIPGSFSDAHKRALEKAALHCPVHQSLHPEVRLPVRFVWD
jgi:putative redox protein